MPDELRDEFAALGQRLEMARWERRDALEGIRALMRKHGHTLATSQVAQLTTIRQSTLADMVSE